MTGAGGIQEPNPEFSTAEMTADPILFFFGFKHLPPNLRPTSGAFATLARYVVDTIPRSAERTVALRKLLESKDAAVRAMLPLPVLGHQEKREPVAEPELGEPVEVGDAEISRDGGPRFTD